MHLFLKSLFRSTRRRNEESGAALGGESRLHPAGVLAVRHRGRQQQRPVVVSSPCVDDGDGDDDGDAFNHTTASCNLTYHCAATCVMGF